MDELRIQKVENGFMVTEGVSIRGDINKIWVFNGNYELAQFI